MAAPSEPQIALEAPRPDRVVETRDERGLALTYRWFTPVHLFMLFFCVAWDGFLFFWYSMALSRHPVVTDPLVWFPLLHVAVGVGLTYSTLAGFVNRTSVVVGGGELSVRHGPLPWPGNRTVATPDIRQLYREERISNTRRGRSASYHLCAVTLDNRLLRVIGSVPGADVALYLEQAIERALGIEDRKVAGEMPK